MKLNYFAVLLLICGLTLSTTQAFATTEAKAGQPLVPNVEYTETSSEILDFLRRGHYQNVEINDALSSKMLDRYIEGLDKSRIYFTQEDIREFEKNRYRLDNDLNEGNLSTAYTIFNRYTQRMTERIRFMMGHLDNGLDSLDFDKLESLEIDREDAPWASNTAELDSLWRKRLKNAVLLLKLSKKSNEEIISKLRSRYRGQLNRAGQFKSSDVFQIYMNAFTALYDPHTQYFSPRTSENFNINMKLSLEGIGAVLQSEDEYTKVLRLVPAGPADNAGQLKPTNRIVGVGQGADGDIIDVIGWRLDDVVDRIRGPKGSIVRLEIIPGDDKADGIARTISIVRDTVKLEEQSAKKEILQIKNDDKTVKIGVIDIPAFYSDYRAQQAGDPEYKSTTRDVLNLLYDLNREKIDGLIIDLRNNGGGSLQEAISLTGLFIRTGPAVQIRSAEGAIQVLGDRDPTFVYTGPLAVIVNRLSASASEIFAGAIQDYQRGMVIGSQTFGKGTVQSLQPLGSGQLKLTQSKFYRISGASTQHRGVIPDILYPSAFDAADIGESALPNALAWDTIPTVNFPKYSNINDYLIELRQRHEKRALTTPDFTYLLEKRKLQDSVKLKTKVSLNEKVRRLERSQADSAQLNMENKLRLAKGKEPLRELSDLEKESADDSRNKIDQEDPLLIESAQILLDYISISAPTVASSKPGQ